VALLFALVLALQTSSVPACGDAADCRTQAEAAAARDDFEAFHELSWRALRKGRPNDTDLMYLLARAQAMSGRYDDAIVMLGRIADFGGHNDAATNQAFERVRLLPKWAEVAAKIGAPLPPPAAATAPANLAPPPVAAKGGGVAKSAASPAGAAPEETLTFDASNLTPLAVGHDAVSRRFLLAHRSPARLVVVDELSHHVVNYASGSSAGFYDELTGFAIDSRRGDLWVVSAKGEGAGASSILHKLQLVSGRRLMEVPLPEDAGATHLAAVTVTPDGTVYALDADSRVFRLRPGAKRLESFMRVDAQHPAALAAADDRVLYIAADGGLVHVDVTSHAASPVKSVEDLTGFDSLAWRSGSLIGVERAGQAYLVVRVALDGAGTRAQPRAILAATTAPIVGTLTNDGFYFVDGGSIKLVRLK
jgi:hypothetical protein